MNMQIKQLQRGFTLVEMAIVLVIFGLLLAALLVPLQAQRDLALQTETNNTLNVARKALLGFAQTQGRLPCPATNNGTAAFPDDTGNASPNASGACAQQVGFLPAATLGIQPTDAQGFALDGWNNRIRYAVTQVNTAGAPTPDFTTTGDMANIGITNLQPNLRVCSTSTNVQLTTCSPLAPIESNFSINNAVIVIYSTGATAGLGSAGQADEMENLNAVAGVDTVFVSHEERGNDPNGEFDHLVVWISPFVLYNAMIEAGQLH
jgi:prepilin-type N-terminal cleavage/methylation domain-containing protein